MDIIFYAHSTEKQTKDDWQSLQEHLTNVGKLAEEFSIVFNCGPYGETAGLLHDLGKYTAEFQKRLEGQHPKVDHATWGAKIAIEKYGQFGYFIAYAIAGHHAGLANGQYRDDQKLTPLAERCEKSNLPELNPIWRKEIEEQLTEKLSPPPLISRQGFGCFQSSFLSRMILSCLVDADRLDTENFCDRAADISNNLRGHYPNLEQLKINFDQKLKSYKNNSEINNRRAAILAAVRHNAKTIDPGLFSA